MTSTLCVSNVVWFSIYFHCSGLTIVRDNSMPHGTEDMYLPTAKTCTSYLKLPAYSSVEVLEQKLLYSMHEGQSTFQLS
jgi:E3 ubiquitin-protein ligase TRIP12